MSAKFDLAEVEAALAGTVFAGQVHHVESTPSTNTLALDAAQRGVATGVWVADEQTAGRGRGGHTWHSVAGNGLYVSVLLRPKLSGVDVLKLSLAAGIAVADAVDTATRARLTLRWPNDVMDEAGEKKLGGILTESGMEAGSGLLSYAVIGIGLNLNQTEMPEELREVASSLRMSFFPGQMPDWLEDRMRRETLLLGLLSQVMKQVGLVEREAAGTLGLPIDAIAARFADYSPMVKSTKVHVAEAGGYTGVTDGLDSHGLLRVRVEGGATRLVRHGGVRPVRETV